MLAYGFAYPRHELGVNTRLTRSYRETFLVSTNQHLPFTPFCLFYLACALCVALMLSLLPIVMALRAQQKLSQAHPGTLELWTRMAFVEICWPCRQ